MLCTVLYFSGSKIQLTSYCTLRRLLLRLLRARSEGFRVAIWLLALPFRWLPWRRLADLPSLSLTLPLSTLMPGGMEAAAAAAGTEARCRGAGSAPQRTAPSIRTAAAEAGKLDASLRDLMFRSRGIRGGAGRLWNVLRRHDTTRRWNTVQYSEHSIWCHTLGGCQSGS